MTPNYNLVPLGFLYRRGAFGGICLEGKNHQEVLDWDDPIIRENGEDLYRSWERGGWPAYALKAEQIKPGSISRHPWARDWVLSQKSSAQPSSPLAQLIQLLDRVSQ